MDEVCRPAIPYSLNYASIHRDRRLQPSHPVAAVDPSGGSGGWSGFNFRAKYTSQLTILSAPRSLDILFGKTAAKAVQIVEQPGAVRAFVAQRSRRRIFVVSSRRAGT